MYDLVTNNERFRVRFNDNIKHRKIFRTPPPLHFQIINQNPLICLQWAWQISQTDIVMINDLGCIMHSKIFIVLIYFLIDLRL